MTNLQDAKALVLAHYDALAAATPESVQGILAARTNADWHWRGMHPWHEQTGAGAVATAFWQPFLGAMRHVQRRQDVCIAGGNAIEAVGGEWVLSMGHLMGLFDAPFLGIPPTRRIAMLRYAEFNRVAAGRIVETVFFCDLLHLMRQAGLNMLPTQLGAHLVQPGPMTHDGLFQDAAPAAEAAATLAAIDRMIGTIAKNSNSHDGATAHHASPRDELLEDWHEDMLWWGPEGIGATYTVDRYAEQHQQPFRKSLADRKFNGHIAKIAQGTFGAFFGWPNLSLRPLGGYLGMPGGSAAADMRVVDVYRRSGDKLAENWVFIDMLHFLNMQGMDVLDRLRVMNGT